MLHLQVLCLFCVSFSALGFLTGCSERIPDILNHNGENIAVVPQSVSLIHHMIDPGCGSGGLAGPCVVTEWHVLVLEAERTHTGWHVDVYEQPNLESSDIKVTNGETEISVIKGFTKIGGHLSFVIESPLPYIELTVFPLSVVNLEIPENDAPCIEIIQNDVLVLEAERIHTGWHVEVDQDYLRPVHISVTDGETSINVVKNFVEIGGGPYSFVLESPLPYMELTVYPLPTVNLETQENDVSCVKITQYVESKSVK